jgi:hypothetical protein
MVDATTAVVKESLCFFMFDGPTAKISKLKLHDGWVCVKVPFIEREGKIGSIHTPIVNSTEASTMVSCHYGVIQTSCKNACNPRDPIVRTYFNKDNSVDVKKGDRVFFSPYVINSIKNGQYHYQSYIKIGEDEFIVIPYKELLCKYRGEEFTPLNRWGIALKHKGIESKLWGVDGAKIEDSITEYEMVCDTFFHKKGDRVIFGPKDALQLLEGELVREMEKEYYFFKEDKPILSKCQEKISFRKKFNLELA